MEGSETVAALLLGGRGDRIWDLQVRRDAAMRGLIGKTPASYLAGRLHTGMLWGLAMAEQSFFILVYFLKISLVGDKNLLLTIAHLTKVVRSRTLCGEC